tara:strand:- start:2220 stop:2684 length:465 start_codon:yes stop_codon:yes gene_type:complete
MSVKVKKIGNVDWDKNLDKVFGSKFKKIVAGIVVKDVKDGLSTGQGTGKGGLGRLKASTVKSKTKKGYRFPSKPLIATGTMKKLPPVKMVSGNAEIAVAKSRSSIAMYHNEGMKPQPKREFFSVSDRAKEKIGRAIGKKVVHILKKSFRLPSKL